MRTKALEVYKILEKIARESQAKTLVEYFEGADTEEIDRSVNTKMEHLATREDLAKEAARLELKTEAVKSDIIKWMFIFWIGQITALVAVYFLK